MCQYLGLVISRKVENIGDTKGVKRPNESLNLDVLAPSRCLKITEIVSFNIANEASHVYILSGHKLIKNAKYGPFWQGFENLNLAVKQCYQTGQF